MSVSGQVTSTVDLADSRVSDSEQSSISISNATTAPFLDGVGAGQINAIWQDTRALADGGTENLICSPTPTSGTSGIVTFARLKAVKFFNPATNTTNITVIRHASTGVPLFNLAGSGVVLKPGNSFTFTDSSAAGVPVSAGQSFTITNSAGAAATYGVVLGGGLT
jgi:hypothetical protein